jgi:iron complex transport system permease protein
MKKLIKKYFWLSLFILVFSLFFINISLGSVFIPLADIFSVLTGGEPSQQVWADILFTFRLPKALTCILSGASLSLGGLLMQTLFRNPLAGPDVFGLSSGASLAVALVVMATAIGIPIYANTFSIALAASLGCAFIFIIVLVIAQRVRDTASLLIIGLMIGAAAASVVSVLQFMSRAEDQQSYLIWTFGSLGSLNWTEIKILTIAVLLGASLAFSRIKQLNGWLLGDNYAVSMGINLKQSRLLIIVSTSLLTGAVTAFCGPIAFVGLAVPHLTRMIIDTSNHKILIPAVMIYGAALMLFCDTLSRLPGNAFIIPINAITALIGAPVVVWIIIRGKKILV